MTGPFRRPGTSWWPLEDIVLPAMVLLGGLALAGMDWREIVESAADIMPSLVDDAPTAPPPLLSVGVEVLPRASWGAHEAKGAGRALGEPRRITVHHQGGRAFESTDLETTRKRIRWMQEFHQNERHWSDLAYHFVVDRDGRVWEGRPLERRGAHAGSASANRANVGIVVLGNFDEQLPSPAQAAALLDLLERACRLWGLQRTDVYTHDEIRRREGLAGTACPGKHLAPLVDAFRAR